MSCGIGCKCGSDPRLLWLWRRLVGAAPIRPPHLGISICHGCGPKKTKKKTKKKNPTAAAWVEAEAWVQSPSLTQCVTGAGADAATAWIQSLAGNFPFHLPYAAGVAIKNKKQNPKTLLGRLSRKFVIQTLPLSPHRDRDRPQSLEQGSFSQPTLDKLWAPTFGDSLQAGPPPPEAACPPPPPPHLWRGTFNHLQGL